jgi:hypothetical protein
MMAIYWRDRPEFHRRLMLIATCELTAAAFVRFPQVFHSWPWFYAGVDLLVFLGVLRDLIVIPPGSSGLPLRAADADRRAGRRHGYTSAFLVMRLVCLRFMRQLH